MQYPQSDTQGGSGADGFATVRLTSQRVSGKGVREDWARYRLELELAHPPQPVRVKGPDGAVICGSRYRLLVRFALWHSGPAGPHTLTRPFPV